MVLYMKVLYVTVRYYSLVLVEIADEGDVTWMTIACDLGVFFPFAFIVCRMVYPQRVPSLTLDR